MPTSSGPAGGTFFFTEGMEVFERNVAPRLVAEAFETMVAAVAPRGGRQPATEINLRLRDGN